MLANRIELLQQYLKEDPDDAFSLYALALEYCNLNDFKKAAGFFSTLIEKHPDYLPAYFHFGKLLEKISTKEMANDIYLKGMELAKKQNKLKTLNEIKEVYNSLNGYDD